MKFWYGSRSGYRIHTSDISPDADPDLALFVSDLQDVNKAFCLLLFEGRIRNQCFSYYFCLMIRIRISDWMGPDPDQRGPKTCGSHGSGSATLISTGSKKRGCPVPPPCPPWLGPSVAVPRRRELRVPGPRWSAGWPAGGTRDAPTQTTHHISILTYVITVTHRCSWSESFQADQWAAPRRKQLGPLTRWQTDRQTAWWM